jgi:hypothetical protein
MTAFGSDTQSWRKNPFLGSWTAPFVKPVRQAIWIRGQSLGFLHMKGLSTKAKDVHTELVQVLWSDAIAYSTVTKYIRNYIILQNEPEAEDRAEDQRFSITDNPILKLLEMMPFASIRQITKMTIIPPMIVFRRFTKSLHFVVRRLCWIDHRLSILKNRLGSSCQRSHWSCLSPWDIIRGGT